MLVPATLSWSLLAAVLNLAPLSQLAPGPQAQEQDPGTGIDCTCSIEPAELPPAQILKLEGKAFFDALVFSSDFHRAAVGDLWELLERCGREIELIDADPEAESDHFHERYACLLVVQRLAKDATAEDLQRIIRAFEGVRPEGDFGRELTEDVLDRKLVLAAQNLPPRATTPLLDELAPLPETSQGAPAEVRDVWRQHRRLQKLYRDLEGSLSQAHGIGVQRHFVEFHRALADYVAGRMTPAEAEETIGRYVWQGWCGTGADALTIPRTKALLLTLIEQGRYDVAAGAALSVPVSMSGEPSIPPELFERVLTTAGFDWESLAAVSFVADPWSKGVALGTHGSERGATLLLAMASLPGGFWPSSNTLAEDPHYLAELAAFLVPSGRCGRSSRETGDRSERTTPSGVTKETELRILDLLATRVGPGAGRREAQAAAALLRRLCRAESLPVFHSMLRSPYPSVQRWGYEGLAAYGEARAGFTPAPPVSFRLLVDGEPLVSSSLGYVVSWTNGGSLSAGIATDADGVATLERDLFVDPKAPVGAVRFSMGLTDDDDGTRLEGSLPPPEDLDAVTVVHLEVAGLPRR